MTKIKPFFSRDQKFSSKNKNSSPKKNIFAKTSNPQNIILILKFESIRVFSTIDETVFKLIVIFKNKWSTLVVPTKVLKSPINIKNRTFMLAFNICFNNCKNANAGGPILAV